MNKREQASKPITNADLAREVTRMGRLAAEQAATLAYGMWNPHFCSADATHAALSFCEDMRSRLGHLERRVGHAEVTDTETDELARTKSEPGE